MPIVDASEVEAAAVKLVKIAGDTQPRVYLARQACELGAGTIVVKITLAGESTSTLLLYDDGSPEQRVLLDLTA